MKTKKSLITLASLAIILLVGVGATLAFLVMKSGPVTNTFVPGNVEVTVQESFAQGGTEKTDVCIKNIGTVDAYIRVAIIPTWEDDEGNPVGVSASLSDLDITWTNNNNWQQGADGFWYYTSPVPAGDSTENLIASATVKTDSAGYNAGYKMNLQILAQGIQADGVDSNDETPVELAWGSGVSGVNDDDSLNIKH
ncbi:MAG: hypothetical protein IJE29_02855 [Firmicutes bacterium]|nr:hypothetical protein [Bacillota bacterium]